MQRDERQQKKHFFDHSKNVQRVLWGLFGCSALLIVIDLFVPIHGEFAWERAPGFYGAFSFVCFVGLVLAGKHIVRPIVKRDEDYYD